MENTTEQLLMGLLAKPLGVLSARLRETAESNEGMARAYRMEGSDNRAMSYDIRAETLRDIIDVIEELRGEME